MSDIAQPHDRFLKALLSDPERAGTLLRERLPKEIAERLADELPELVDGSFVDEDLRSHLSDRLYRVRTTTGREALLYVLIEHKSQPDRKIGWQLFKYIGEALKQWEREHPEWELLPAIVPFVFYHGEAEWRIPNEFLSLVDAEAGWLPWLLDFRFTVMDLGKIPDPLLSGQPRLQAWLMVAKYATRQVAFAEIKGPLIEVMAQAPEDLPALIRYMIETFDDVSGDDLGEVIRGVKPEEEMEMMSQFAQEMIAKGDKQGWNRGRQEGRQEGEVAVLKRLLHRRFGALPEWAVEQISQADLDTLETWTDRVLDAQSLEEVLGDRS